MKNCHKCGSAQEWVECWNCGGKGGRDYDEDLQFEDPLWYSPGDFIKCDICQGKGGWFRCLNDKCETNTDIPVNKSKEWAVEGNSGSGYLVEAKSGKGRTYHNKKLVNDKVQVFLADGRKMLCDPTKLKVIGFID